MSPSADRVAAFTRADLTFPTEDTGPIDGEPVLLLHGWPQDGRSWDRVTPALTAAGYRSFAPTLRGATPGANPRPRRAYRGPELLGDVAAMIERIGAPVHLVGHDWGAALAWTVAVRRPDLVTTLTAVSVPHPAAFLNALRRPAQLRRSWYMAFFQLPVVPELALAADGVRRRVLRASGQSSAAARRDAGRLDSYALRRGGFNWYRGALLSAPRDLGPATVPVLQVWSDGDVAVGRASIEASRAYARGGYRLVVLEGVSHWIPDVAADRLSDALLAHLRAHPRATGA
ncbi:MAG: alpha/beta fold hydrolase [Jatrophihabitans sp.]|nr:MAG: alpha/beta fold hydrolase [Jatrophihabitans sp.]